MTETYVDPDVVLDRIRSGDEHAFAEVFSHYRDRLWHTVNLRIDQRLSGRVDADDILQEVYLDASDRLRHYVRNPSVSLLVWLHMITSQTLTNVHRRHLDAQMRDAKREFSIFARPCQPASTSLAMQLLGQLTSPSNAAMREETARKLEEAIQRMDPIDQEVLTLRHFDQLSNKEVAEALGIQSKAASIRYVRALQRLKGIIDGIPGLSDAS